MSHTHENAIVSILSGIISAIGIYIKDHDGIMMDFGLELLKICIFGFAGGIFGYVGKLSFIEVRAYFKRRRK